MYFRFCDIFGEGDLLVPNDDHACDNWNVNHPWGIYCLCSMSEQSISLFIFIFIFIFQMMKFANLTPLDWDSLKRIADRKYAY